MKAEDERRFGTKDVALSPMPAAYVRVLLQVFANDDATQTRLLDDTAIDPAALPGANETIALWQYLRFVDNLTLLEPRWGIRIDLVNYASAHGTVGVACQSAARFGDALRVLARFAHLRAPYFRLAMVEDDELVKLVIGPLVDLESVARRPLLESLLLSLQGVIESTWQRPLRTGAFDIAGTKTSTAEQYGAVFHAPVRFGARHHAVAVPRSWLSLDNPMADASQHADAVFDLESLERRFGGRGGLAREVARLIQESDDVPSLSEVATRLDVSRRTLERRLSIENTSFRDLVQQRLRWKAERLLEDDSLTVADISGRLGYSDLAAFGRACRRWFGMSPQAYREQGTQSRRSQAGRES